MSCCHGTLADERDIQGVYQFDFPTYISYTSVINRKRFKNMPETATLSSKFQISIPKAIRTAQHWEAGLIFTFIPKGTGVLLVPAPTIDTLKGLANGANAKDYRDRSDRTP